MSKIAVVLADDFEDVEYTNPKAALVEAGHEVEVIGTDTGIVCGKQGTEVHVDLAAADADPADYSALLIPGGFSPDHLRTDGDIVKFVAEMARSAKPVAAICHAPSLLIEADVVDGRTMTSFPSIRTDLRNAGATVVDDQVVIDEPFITSRNPDDLAAFSAALVRALL